MTGTGSSSCPDTGGRLLRAIARTGGVLSASAAVAGLAMMWIADQGDRPAIESLTGELGLSLFIFGVLSPFGFWAVHLAVRHWIGDSDELTPSHDSRGVFVGATAAYGLLALGVFTVALMPFLAFTPDDGAGVVDRLPQLIGGLFCLSVAIAAITGGVALFGWAGAVAGTITGAGFTLTVVSYLLPDVPPLHSYGIALLVLGVAAFLGLRRLAVWLAEREGGRP